MVAEPVAAGSPTPIPDPDPAAPARTDRGSLLITSALSCAVPAYGRVPAGSIIRSRGRSLSRATGLRRSECLRSTVPDGDWFYDNIVEPGKLPMLLCLGAFVVTFILTRVITRMIRAGIGPFKNNVSASGLHIHHAVPGILLLILGALMAIRGPDSPWFEIAGVIIGIGTSLILDEFALILHLEDVYWTDEGRVSVELAGLTAACIGFAMLGLQPAGRRRPDGRRAPGPAHPDHRPDHPRAADRDLPAEGQVPGGPDQLLRADRVAWISAIRLARPHSWWARHRYRGPKKQESGRSQRAQKFDRRWDPKWRWLSDMIAGAPSEPDPPETWPAGDCPGWMRRSFRRSSRTLRFPGRQASTDAPNRHRRASRRTVRSGQAAAVHAADRLTPTAAPSSRARQDLAGSAWPTAHSAAQCRSGRRAPARSPPGSSS